MTDGPNMEELIQLPTGLIHYFSSIWNERLLNFSKSRHWFSKCRVLKEDWGYGVKNHTQRKGTVTPSSIALPESPIYWGAKGKQGLMLHRRKTPRCHSAEYLELTQRRKRKRCHNAERDRAGIRIANPSERKNAPSMVKKFLNWGFYDIRPSEKKSQNRKNGAFFLSFIAFLVKKENAPCPKKYIFFWKRH